MHTRFSKSILSAALALALAFLGVPPLPAAAAESSTFAEGGIVYRVVSEAGSGQASVQVGTGAQKDANTSVAGELVIPASVEHGGVSYAVTGVASYAFYGCTGLSGIAFAEGAAPSTIGQYAFGNCSSLTSLEVPRSVTDIGRYAFSNCASLATLSFEDPEATGPELRLGEGAFRVPKGAACSLSSVQLPARLANIPAAAFENQTAITSVTCLAQTMTSVGSHAFMNCSSVELLEIPDFTSTSNPVGTFAFTNMMSLRTISFVGDQSYSVSDSTFSAYLNANVFYNETSRVYPDIETVLYHGDHATTVFADANHYQRAVFYQTEGDAESGAEPLSEAYLRTDVALSELVNHPEGTDSKGAYVYRGEVPGAGQGKSWHFLDMGQSGYATGLVRAFPVDSGDLSYAEVTMEGDPLVYRGKPVSVDYGVVAPGGGVLARGVDYAATIRDASGATVAGTTVPAVGRYTLEVEGRGSYTGSTSRDFEVVEHACTWTRSTGNARYSTPNHMLDTAFSPDDVDTVVLVGESSLAAGAAAGGVAGVRSAPIVVTSDGSLSAEARRNLRLYAPDAVLLVGITDADAVEAEIAGVLDANVTVTNAFVADTPQDVSYRLYSRTVGSGYWDDTTTAVVASADDVASAALAGTYAYRSKSPVFLTGEDSKLSADEASAIAKGGFERVLFVGLPTTATARVGSQLGSAGYGGSFEKLGAQDPYGLSVEAAGYAIEKGLGSPDKPVLVSPADPASAVTAVATCGENQAPLLYADNCAAGHAALTGFLQPNRYSISEGHVCSTRGYLSAEFQAEVESIWRVSDAADLAQGSIRLSQDVFAADGSAHALDVTVTDKNGRTLVPGTDYTLAYYANATDKRTNDTGFADAGSYTVMAVASSTGAYTGSIGTTFTVGATDLAKASVSVSASGASYTGKEIRPRVAVSYGGTTLAEGSDYELSYANNLDAGHAVVTVTGTGSYAGRNLATFDIAPLDLSKAKVRTVKKGLAYTGKAQRPALKVTVGSVTLRAGIDYSVSYPKAVNAGSYTLKVTGGENAPGTARARFTIGKAKQKVTVGKAVRTFRARDLKRHAAAFSLGAKAKTRLSYTVPAKARKAGVTVSSKGRVSLAKGTAKGTYTVVARAKGSANYQPATKKIAVRVK